MTRKKTWKNTFLQLQLYLGGPKAPPDIAAIASQFQKILRGIILVKIRGEAQN